MKIGLLTFHRADNYGALLQVYALQEALKKCGHEVEIIDYRCDAIENDYVNKILPPLRKNIIAWFMSLMHRLYVMPKKNKKKSKCIKFREDFLKLSCSVKSNEDRKKIQETFDVIITGSDQIWSSKLTAGKDDWYCFKQESNIGADIVAYGASVGNLSKFVENFELFKSDLAKYKMISVREDETRDFLKSKLSISVEKVVDPTLLIEKKSWDKLISKNTMKINGDYILYYDVERNFVAKEIALKISKTNKIKLVHFDPSFKLINKGFFAQEVGPCEFLSLIRNAKYVVTSSFHATVFAVLFEKQFITVPHPQTGARVKTLLNDFSLENRICETTEDYSQERIDAKINYESAFSKLDVLKNASIDYLLQCMKKVTDK